MSPPDPRVSPAAAAKVPAVTLLFWVLKIAATTLGETGGDAVSMSLGLGYLVGSLIFGLIFVGAVALQIRARAFHPALYWLTIIATTTVGTTMADWADRSLGIGYAGGSALLLALLAVSLLAWKRALGSVSIRTVATPAAEAFYWVTILFSQTLGTALGDWMADDAGLGYLGAGAVFAGLLLLVLAGYLVRRDRAVLWFWLAFVLTRPLGAALGDFLDKPVAHGGLGLGRFAASAVLLAFIVGCLLRFRQRAAPRAH